jgi:hypothetical protein
MRASRSAGVSCVDVGWVWRSLKRPRCGPDFVEPISYGYRPGNPKKSVAQLRLIRAAKRTRRLAREKGFRNALGTDRAKFFRTFLGESLRSFPAREFALSRPRVIPPFAHGHSGPSTSPLIRQRLPFPSPQICRFRLGPLFGGSIELSRAELWFGRQQQIPVPNNGCPALLGRVRLPLFPALPKPPVFPATPAERLKFQRP